jgi:AAA+ superfamily predicted ATPase
VGVLLRMLEYYRGVMFLTTNRGTIVDDAIISRLTARFSYQMPTEIEQMALWRILAEQNRITIDPMELRKIAKTLPRLSGRDIKNLLKLAYIYSLKKQTSITCATMQFVSRFKQAGHTNAPVEGV